MSIRHEVPEGIESKSVSVNGLDLHYLEAGSGEPILLLHGWPTSAYLWRHTMPAMAKHNRVIALDMPGFGASSKPLDASYSFGFHARTLDAFCEAIGVNELGLAVHDLGGPVGLYWGLQQPERIRKLALLNTIVYPQMSWAVMLFVAICRLPGARHWLTSPAGLRFAMRFGVCDKAGLSEQTIAQYQAPFVGREARAALAKTAYGLHPGGFVELARRLPEFRCPVRIVYGSEDRILPDVAKTMARVQRDLPQAVATALPGCGHFLQEDQPQEVGRLLAEFFAAGA